jgi:hypothetical protein
MKVGFTYKNTGKGDTGMGFSLIASIFCVVLHTYVAG